MDIIHAFLAAIAHIFNYTLPGITHSAQGFDYVGMGLGAASSLASPIIDWITGASARRNDAMNRYQSGLRDIARRIRGDAGNNAADSLYFKTAQSQLDNSYKNNLEKQQRVGAIGGQTEESKLGALDSMNDTYQSGMLQTLGNSEQVRQSLLDRAEGYDTQAAGVDVQRSQADLDAQNKLGAGIATSIPSLYMMLNGGKKKANAVVPWGEEYP